jgi:hypothetical protein
VIEILSTLWSLRLMNRNRELLPKSSCATLSGRPTAPMTLPCSTAALVYTELALRSLGFSVSTSSTKHPLSWWEAATG